jgi:hypothetical protein
MDRRVFLEAAGTPVPASVLPVSMVELAFADESENLTFANLSDARGQHIHGIQFVCNCDHGAEIMSKLRFKTHYVMGDHDYYVDLDREDMVAIEVHANYDRRGVPLAPGKH